MRISTSNSTGSDIVDVFTAGEFEDDIPMNSRWHTGDWNGDHEFDTADFVKALTHGGYESGRREPLAAVPEPGVSWLISLLGLFPLSRRYVCSRRLTDRQKLTLTPLLSLTRSAGFHM